MPQPPRYALALTGLPVSSAPVSRWAQLRAQAVHPVHQVVASTWATFTSRPSLAAMSRTCRRSRRVQAPALVTTLMLFSMHMASTCSIWTRKVPA